MGCRQSLREQRDLAFQQAKDEEAHVQVEATVAVRTAELRRANAALHVEVSERSRIEDALRGARPRLASSPWSPHTPITRLFSLMLTDASNGSMTPSLALLDTKSTRFVGRTPGSFLQGRQTDATTAALMRERIHAGQGFQVEILNYDKAGKPFWVMIEVQPIRDESGTLTRFIGVQTDITMRKCAERRLTAQHAAMRVLAESVSLDDAIPRLLRAVGESLGLDRGEYWQIDPASGVLDLVHDWSAAPEEDREFAAGSRKNHFARGMSLTGRVWALGRPAWTGDLANDDHFARRELAARRGFVRRGWISDRQRRRDDRRHGVPQQICPGDGPVARRAFDDARPPDRHVHRTPPRRR